MSGHLTRSARDLGPISALQVEPAAEEVQALAEQIAAALRAGVGAAQRQAADANDEAAACMIEPKITAACPCLTALLAEQHISPCRRRFPFFQPILAR